MSSSNTGAVTSTPSSPGPIEEKIDRDTKSILSSSPLPQSPTQPWISKKTLSYVRLSIFFTLEVAYIILAAVCLAKPVPIHIHLNLTDAEVKGGFTVIFVIWQSIAILSGAYFAADAFSREWSFQLAHITPGTTDRGALGTVDRVSTMTSGFIDRTSHLLFNKPSGTFKLAFLASLSFILLSSLAPGTINAATTLIDTPVMIQIGRLLSNPADSDIPEVIAAQSRAYLILRLEKIENSPFGFKLPDNMLTAVPRVDLSSFNGTLEYNSDVIEFHHDCHWEAPQFFNTSNGLIVTTAGGQQWNGATVGNGPIKIGSSVGPLSLATLPIMEQVGLPAFIFSGGNSSISIPQSNPPTPFAVDLGSLPVTFTPSGAGLELASDSVYAPLSTVLVCDPQTKITGGRIRVTNDGTLTVITSGQTPIGNIPQSAANLIFTNAFQVSLVQLETLTLINAVNNVASNMFMSNASTVNWETARNIRPLDLPSINKNVDTYMLSAAKAYIDGYNKNGTSTAVDFTLDTVSAMGQTQAFALSTSKGLFIATVVLVVISAVLVLAIFTSLRKRERLPFNLNNVFMALNQGGERGVVCSPEHIGA